MPVEKRILHLTLKKKWFDLTAAGLKPEDYREDKRYWNIRLLKHLGNHKQWIREFDEIHYTNGYGKDKPFCRVKWNGILWGYGSLLIPKNGEILYPYTPYFRIINGPVIETRNWENPFD